MSKGKIALALLGAFAIYNARQRRRSDAPVYYRKRMAGGYNARTIPPFGIYIDQSQAHNTALLNHEKVHWQQYQRMGLVPFYAHYLKQLRQYGYDHMPMEVEARANENPHCRFNYTECVRNGTAKTIYNPNFRT